MTRILFIILAFVSTSIFSQTPNQGLKILLKEKTKGDKEILIRNTNVIIALNDSIKHNVTTDEKGMLAIETRAGKLSVTVIRDSCQTITMNGVIVAEGKRAYLTFELTCPNYINSLTKKELKKLGYKRITPRKN